MKQKLLAVAVALIISGSAFAGLFDNTSGEAVATAAVAAAVAGDTAIHSGSEQMSNDDFKKAAGVDKSAKEARSQSSTTMTGNSSVTAAAYVNSVAYASAAASAASIDATVANVVASEHANFLVEESLSLHHQALTVDRAKVNIKRVCETAVEVPDAGLMGFNCKDGGAEYPLIFVKNNGKIAWITDGVYVVTSDEIAQMKIKAPSMKVSQLISVDLQEAVAIIAANQK